LTQAVSAPESASAPGEEKPRSGSIYLALLPWVLFSLIARFDTLTAASVIALVGAVVVALPSIRRGRPKSLEIGAIVTFAAFTVAAFIVSDSVADDISRYARGIAALVLALIAFGSLARTPFTEEYARETVPRQFWNSPTFKALNRRITILWGFVFLAMVPCHVVAGAIDTRRANTIFNWVIPVALVVWASKRTAEISDSARGEHEAPASAGIPGS
jgi:hypothetical protein